MGASMHACMGPTCALHACRETYEQRLLRPFSDALPPPPHFHPSRMVVHKPDLPPVYGVQVCMVCCCFLATCCPWCTMGTPCAICWEGAQGDC